MHLVFVLALLNSASALSECQTSECAGDQTVSLLALGRTNLKEQAKTSLTKASAAVLSMIEKAESSGYELSPADEAIISPIEALVDEIIAGAESEHAVDQSNLNIAAGNVNNCGTVAQSHLDGAVSTAEVDAGTAGGNHDTCRQEESALAGDRNTHCGAYDTHRSTTAVPACAALDLTFEKTASSDPGDRLEMEACAVEVNVWATAFVALQEPCQDAIDALSPKANSCNGLQGTFETKSCEWKDEQDDACDEQDSCRGTWVYTFETSAAHAAVNGPARKADYVSASRIKCYLGVFGADAGDRAGILAECRAATHNTDHLTLTIPTYTDATACTKLTSYPCLSEFTNTNYLAKAWYGQAPPSLCGACS